MVSMVIIPIYGSLSENNVKLLGKLWHEQLSELCTMLSPFSSNMYLVHPNALKNVGQFVEYMAEALNLLSQPCVTIQIQTCDDSTTLTRSASQPHHSKQWKKMINLVKFSGMSSTLSVQIFMS